MKYGCGDLFEGWWYNHVRQGNGVMRFAEGHRYEGTKPSVVFTPLLGGECGVLLSSMWQVSSRTI